MSGWPWRLIAGISLLSISAEGLAQKGPVQSTTAEKIEFRVPWILVPQEPDTSTLQVKEGEKVTSARMTPARLLVMATDLKTTDGRSLIAAGTEMSLTVSNHFLACTIKPLDSNTLERLLVASSRYLCAIDRDRDGAFDQYFFEGSIAFGLLSGKGKAPRQLQDLGTNSYRQSPDAMSTDGPSLELRYVNFAFLSGWLLFEVCITGPNRRCDFLEGNFGVKKKDLPDKFSAFGGLFEVTEKNDAGLKIRMLRPFTPTPMMIN